MVQVTVTTKDNVVNNIKISGHANFANHGKDIVCASVSSIAITTINALVRIDQECIKYNELEGLIDLTVLKQDKTVVTLIENMISLLQELEKQYPKNIKIK